MQPQKGAQMYILRRAQTRFSPSQARSSGQKSMVGQERGVGRGSLSTEPVAGAARTRGLNTRAQRACTRVFLWPLCERAHAGRPTRACLVRCVGSSVCVCSHRGDENDKPADGRLRAPRRRRARAHPGHALGHERVRARLSGYRRPGRYIILSTKATADLPEAESTEAESPEAEPLETETKPPATETPEPGLRVQDRRTQDRVTV